MQNRNLKKILKTKLKDAKRIAVLGIGSELRGDDAAGILIAKGIKYSAARLRSILLREELLASATPCVDALSSSEQAPRYSRAVIKAIPGKSPKLKIFLGETAPENLTGEIKKYNPTHLIIIDSAEIGKKPGDIDILEPNKIKGITFSTHKLPVKILTDYLLNSINCDIIIIGIQPKSLEFGSKLSKEITKSVNEISFVLKNVLID